MPPVDVSVVIPCHNHGSFLREAVESVIHQEDVTVEVIVVDDGSTQDLSPELCDIDFTSLAVIRQEHRGTASARNAGAARASGAFLAFLDADDYWAAGRLRRALSALTSSSSAMMAFAMMQEFVDSSLLSSGEPLPQVRTLTGISASGLVVARENFERVGAFDPCLATGEFIDWYLRADQLGVITHVDEQILVYRRIHDGNRDRWRRPVNREYTRILMRSLKERRGLE